jgi:hypothetical protein
VSIVDVIGVGAGVSELGGERFVSSEENGHRRVREKWVFDAHESASVANCATTQGGRYSILNGGRWFVVMDTVGGVRKGQLIFVESVTTVLGRIIWRESTEMWKVVIVNVGVGVKVVYLLDGESIRVTIVGVADWFSVGVLVSRWIVVCTIGQKCTIGTPGVASTVNIVKTALQKRSRKDGLGITSDGVDSGKGVCVAFAPVKVMKFCELSFVKFSATLNLICTGSFTTSGVLVILPVLLLIFTVTGWETCETTGQAIEVVGGVTDEHGFHYLASVGFTKDCLRERSAPSSVRGNREDVVEASCIIVLTSGRLGVTERLIISSKGEVCFLGHAECHRKGNESLGDPGDKHVNGKGTVPLIGLVEHSRDWWEEGQYIAKSSLGIWCDVCVIATGWSHPHSEEERN